MDTQKLNSALFSQFTTQNGKHNFEVSKLSGLLFVLGFFSPSISKISAGVRNGGRHPHTGKSGKNTYSAGL